MKKLLIFPTLFLAASANFCSAMENKNSKTTNHAVIEINSKNFEEFAAAKKPLILDAWAEWCGPCKQMKPIFEELAKNNSDYTFGSLDIQKEAELGKKLQIRSLPTFLVIKENKEYGRIVGAAASCAKELLEKINACLANENPQKIGSKIALTGLEINSQLNSLFMKPEKDQIEELKELFKTGVITPDMVLVDLPSMNGMPAIKLTVISNIILRGGKALFQVLLDQGANINKVKAEIDSVINKYNKEIARLNKFNNMLQTNISENDNQLS